MFAESATRSGARRAGGRRTTWQPASRHIVRVLSDSSLSSCGPTRPLQISLSYAWPLPQLIPGHQEIQVLTHRKRGENFDGKRRHSETRKPNGTDIGTKGCASLPAGSCEGTGRGDPRGVLYRGRGLRGVLRERGEHVVRDRGQRGLQCWTRRDGPDSRAGVHRHSAPSAVSSQVVRHPPDRKN